MRTGPMSAKDFLWAKTYPALLPMILVGEGLALASATILDAHTIIIGFAIVTALGLSFGLSGLAVGMGAMYPDFKTDNSAKLAASPAGMLYMVFCFIVGIFDLDFGRPSGIFSSCFRVEWRRIYTKSYVDQYPLSCRFGCHVGFCLYHSVAIGCQSIVGQRVAQWVI